MKLVRTIAASMPLLLPVACLATTTALAGCASFSFNSIVSSVQRSQTVADAKSLTVESRNGSITLVKDASATQMTVSAKIRCSGATKEEADKRAEESKLVVDRQADGAVRVTVSYPPRANGAANGSNDGATIEIRAASLTGINLATSNGSIKADGFDGDLKARSSNGAIKIAGHNGSVQVDTSNGSIDALQVAGPVDLETSNGSIDAELAEGSSQSVNAKSSNGSVKLTLPGSWNGAMNAKTSNGRVTVKAPEGRATNVSTARSEGSATIGNGNAEATVRTSNGSVLVNVKNNKGDM
jgi:DUF4097 and DUF4098 domain-containing protein YvlB